METGFISLESSERVLEPSKSETLHLLTLNLAHGRGIRAHQLFLREAIVREHLHGVARFLHEIPVDIAAFQECDISSFWNGAFNHLEYLREKAPQMPYGVTAQHMHRLRLSYGTSILSRHCLGKIQAFQYRDAVPLPRKGFLTAELSWPGYSEYRFLLVSLHLDFLRVNTRAEQIGRVASAIASSGLPCIVMGDFNCTWQDSPSAVVELANQCNLHAFTPEDTNLSTFRFRSKRWDWILLSQEFTFLEQKIFRRDLSDHYPVWAKIARR